MQELTLTGGTMLANYNMNSSSDQQQQQVPPNSNNAASLLSLESSPFTIAHEHTAGSSTVAAAAAHHKSHNHQQQHSKACCSAHVSTVKPVLTLKKPASELAEEYDDRHMYQTVQQCVRMGSYELVVELVQAWKENRGSNASVVDRVLHEYDAAGHTLTHWSAKRVDDVRFVHFFLKIPYHPDTAHDDHDTDNRRTLYPTVVHRPTRDETAMTPLHWVATQPHAIPVLQALLDATTTGSRGFTNNNVPSGLELRDATGCTPLLIAAQHGHVETVAYLLQKGADIHKTDSSNDSATHWAAYKGSEQVLGLLSFYDTRQLSTPDAYGQTPLHLAALRGHATVIRFILQTLLTPKAGSTSHNQRSARLAAQRDVKDLLFLKDQNGRTPYELAVHKEKPAAAAVLQQAAEILTVRSWQQQIRRALTFQSLKKFCRIQTCKVWLGLPEVDDVDESPRLPFYYVIAMSVVHIFYYFSVFLPVASPEDGVLWDRLGLHVFEIMLMAATLYCLYKCSTTNPGRLDQKYPGIETWRRLYEQTLDAYASEDIERAEKAARVQLCHTCHIARPPRSKHDRFSRSCILVFDHHCPFVGSSVGLYNYKWFLGVLAFMSFYLLNFLCLLFLYYRRMHNANISTLLFGLFLGLHIFFPAGMWIYHTQLVMANLTTNEHVNTAKYDYLWDLRPDGTKRFHNPWNKGFLGNLMDRFSPGDHCYLLQHDPDRDTTKLLGHDDRLSQHHLSDVI